MNGFRQRVPSKDVAIFVGTILIQQRVGGNLSAVLSNMSETLEERNGFIKRFLRSLRKADQLPIFLSSCHF